MSIKTIDLHFMGMPGAIAVYLLETEIGPILFETGPHRCLPELKKGLHELGYQVEDIKHVVLTHIHLDHAGGAWYFAEKGAKIYVHQKGEAHLSNPNKLIESATKIYGDQMDLLWGQFKAIDPDQLVVADHQEEFTFGNETIRALHTPGHAVHHIAWHTNHGIICGDVAGIRIQHGPPMPPCPPPDINFKDWRQSIDVLLAESPSTIYISHFGVSTEAISHLQNLKEELDILEDYLYSLYAKNPDPRAAIGPFSTWVEKRISTLTDTEEMINRYNIANPPFMTVNGVFRYFRKRDQ